MAVQYRQYKDAIAVFRDGVRSASFMLDVEITATGFAGIEDTDWKNLEQTA